MNPRNPRNSILAVVLIIAAGVLAYSNSFKVPFILDSVGQIEYQGAVHSLSRWKELWQRDPSRFIPFFTFALNYHFGRYEVFGYHLVNLLIHLANALLVYWLVLTTLRLNSALSPQPLALSPEPSAPWVWALVAGLIFVAHPLQTQAVTYVVQRMESLAALFYLLTLCLYLKARLSSISVPTADRRPPTADSLPRGGWFWFCYVGALLSFVLGCMSKEIIVTAPVLLAIYEWLFLPSPTPNSNVLRQAQHERLSSKISHTNPVTLSLSKGEQQGSQEPAKPSSSRLSTLNSRLSIKPLVPFFALMFLPFILAGMKPGSLAQDHVEATRLGIGGIFFGDWDYWGRYIFTQGRVLWTYVRLFFLPVGQNLDYDYPVATSFFGPPFVAAWLAWIALVVGGWGFFRRQHLVILGAAWFFLVLSVTSLVPLGMVIFEHRMYLPFIGIIFLLVGVFVSLSPFSQRGLQWVTVLLVVPVLVWATYSRNYVWGNTERLWRDVVAKSPHKSRGYTHLGAALAQKGDREGALAQYLKAIEVNPQLATGHVNVADELFRKGDIQGALRYGWRALELEPDTAIVHYNLAVFLEARGETQEADARLDKALKLAPEDAALHNRAGNLLWERGDVRGALRLYQKAVALDPGYAEAENNLANALRNLGHRTEAIVHYRRSIETQPDYAVAHLNLASILHEQGEFASAITHYRRALELDPKLVPAYQRLGSALLSRGREEAIKVYRDLLAVSPGNPAAVQALQQLGAGDGTTRRHGDAVMGNING